MVRTCDHAAISDLPAIDAFAVGALSGNTRSMQSRSLVTQNRILNAAVQALVEFGYAGATTLRIQEMADVSRGRMLHQYPSRDELLVAAVHHLASARVDDAGAQGDWPAAPRARICAVVDAMWATFQQDYFWAATELWIGARHNDGLRAALVPVERALYSRVRTATDAMFGVPFIEAPAYPVMRELLTTSMRGVALTYAFDRRRPSSEPALTLWKDLALDQLLGPDRDL